MTVMLVGRVKFGEKAPGMRYAVHWHQVYVSGKLVNTCPVSVGPTDHHFHCIGPAGYNTSGEHYPVQLATTYNQGRMHSHAFNTEEYRKAYPDQV